MYRTNEFDLEERKFDPTRSMYYKARFRSWVEKLIVVSVLVLVGLAWNNVIQPVILDQYDGLGRWIQPS